MIIVIIHGAINSMIYKSTFFVLKHTLPAGKYFTILINKANVMHSKSN